MRAFDINSSELIKFSKKLDKIGNRAAPIAARQTLNSLAFEAKKNIPIEAKKMFVTRAKGFFRAFSRVEMAKGLNVNSMFSKAGMKGDKEAVRNQRQQQQSGAIKGRTFIPLDTARKGDENSGRVLKRNQIKNIDISFNTEHSRGGNHKKRFVQTAVRAIDRFGNGAVIRHKTKKGKTFLYRIEIGGSDVITRDKRLKVTPLYSVQKGRSAPISKRSPFTLVAGEKAGKKATMFFKKHAKRQFDRFL